MVTTISPATNFPETFKRKITDTHELRMDICHISKVGNENVLINKPIIVNVINATKHAIPLYRPEDCVNNGRKNIRKEGATPYYLLPEGFELNVQYETEISQILGFQVSTRKVASFDIPLSFNGVDIVICSAQYAQAANSLKHNTEAHDTLFLGIDTLYDEGGVNVVGAIGFIAQQ